MTFSLNFFRNSKSNVLLCQANQNEHLRLESWQKTTPILAVACLVLVLVVALKEDRLIQRQVIHDRGTFEAWLLVENEVATKWWPCPPPFKAYKGRPGSVEQSVDVVAPCPNTSPLHAATFPKVGVYHQCGLGEVPLLHHLEAETVIDLPVRNEMRSWHTTFPTV